MERSSVCLQLERVSRDFGGLKAVDGVSMTVQAGERRALIGPNGAGKTTLFNLISGELGPTSGRIALDGIDVTRLAPHRRAARGVARTFQITNLFPNLTVFENVLLACLALERRTFAMHRSLRSCAGAAGQARRLLDTFGLHAVAGELARNLSHGDQRKVEISLAVAGRPRLLLLDEPMAGLSSAECDAMQGVLATLDPAITVLLIEHDMDVAFGIADRITVLHQGRVLTEGTRDEIRADPAVQEIYLGSPAGLHDAGS